MQAQEVEYHYCEPSHFNMLLLPIYQVRVIAGRQYPIRARHALALGLRAANMNQFGTETAYS